MVRSDFSALPVTSLLSACFFNIMAVYMEIGESNER
jgi:hypothetical protein